jgi:nucleoid-associated protein YgaU
MSLSPFETFTPLNGGLLGTAPAIFAASTTDDEATLTKPGYINELYEQKQIKEQDWLFINYAEMQSNLFIVKNTAKETELPFIQLVKMTDLKPPTPPPPHEK